MSILTESSPKATHPLNTLITLKNHQLSMLQRCYDIESNKKGLGIMSDKPGAGKTYVVLSLILNSKKQGKTNVIVIPQNIYHQWITSINNFTHHLTYQCFVEYQEVSSLYYSKLPKNIDLFITTPLYFNIVNDALIAVKSKVNRVFVDEIDSVDFIFKNGINCCDMLWLVSASFSKNVLERMNIKSSQVDQLTCKCDDDYVLSCFPLPDYIVTTILCVSTYLDDILYSVLSPMELSAANAYDFSKISNQHIKNVATTEKEAFDYILRDIEITIQNEKNNIEHYENLLLEQTDPIEIYNLKSLINVSNDNLEQAQKKYEILYERLKSSDMCLICYDNMNKNRVISSCCQNTFCETCLSVWYQKNNTCPYCRCKVEYESHILLINKESIDDDDNIDIEKINVKQKETPQSLHKDKMTMLEDLLDNNVGAKVIIFSDYSKVFKKIADLLDHKDITYVELDGGNITEIENKLYSYKSGDARVLLSNSSFYGCGMNLENTTDIIFFHKTQESMYKQVIGRAQRPGRLSALNVYNLYHNNELDS